MAKTMFKIEDICVELDNALKENNIQLKVMDLIGILFLKDTTSAKDEVFFGVLCVIFLILFQNNWITIDLKKDIKKVEEKTTTYDTLFLKLKKCNFRCMTGIMYLKIIDEDYLFFLNLLDKIQPEINIDKTMEIIKESI